MYALACAQTHAVPGMTTEWLSLSDVLMETHAMCIRITPTSINHSDFDSKPLMEEIRKVAIKRLVGSRTIYHLGKDNLPDTSLLHGVINPYDYGSNDPVKVEAAKVWETCRYNAIQSFGIEDLFLGETQLLPPETSEYGHLIFPDRINYADELDECVKRNTPQRESMWEQARDVFLTYVTQQL